jgi:uncharacterized damage-inducible protein DinB
VSDATGTTRAVDPNVSLHPRLQVIAALLDEARAEMLEAARDIPPALRAVRPSPDRWSAAEVVAHLAKVEDGSGRLFSKGAKVVRESGAPPEDANFSERDAQAMLEAFDRFGVRARLRKFDAPSVVMPAEAPDFDEACQALVATRARLLQAMQQASGLALATFSAPHPRLGDMNLYEWLLLIARHEQRHVLQLKEIRQHFADEYDA